MIAPRRLLGALVLGSWCALFWFLLATDRTPLYLSSRTDWLVPVGAAILTGATVGRVLSLRAARPEPASRSELLGSAVLIVPVIVVLALPPASLGAFAASRRGGLSTAGISATAAEISEGDITLVDVASALRAPDAMEALRERAREQVSFVGFVSTDPSDPADAFTLNRFIISCCVADALVVKVRVVGAPPGYAQEDDWVRVTGAIFPLGSEVAVEAAGVEKVPRPKHPYLNP